MEPAVRPIWGFDHTNKFWNIDADSVTLIELGTGVVFGCVEGTGEWTGH